MCYMLTTIAQTNGTTQNISNSYESAAPLGPIIKPLFMIQGAMTKSFSDQDGSFATSISMGIKYLNKFGITANIQPTGLDNGIIDYFPISLERSFTAERHKIRPFVNMQLGHVFSKSEYSISSVGIQATWETRGTAFFSPGIGLLIPVKKQSGILLTLSYINSGYKTEITAESPGGIVNKELSKYNEAGFRIGAGFKF